MRLGEQGLPSEQEFVCLCSQLLGRLWEEAMPKPAQRIAVWVNLHAPSLNELRCYTFMRPDEHSDSLLEHVDFGPLLRHLDADNVLAVFASLLVERRIIFVADGVSTLSACVQAMVALLYPFSWQHVFIPVLPRSMLTYCCAPMPFVVGVLRSAVPELRAMSDSMEDVVLIDIDNNKYIAPPTIQDTEFMPPATVGPLHDIIDVHRRAILAKLPSIRQHQSQPLTRKTKSKSVGSLFAAAATQFNTNHNNAAVDTEEQSLAGADNHNDVEENKKEMPQEAMQNLANGFVAFMVDLLASYRSFIISPSERERQRQEQLMQLPAEERGNAHIVVDCFDRINFVASQPIELQPILHFLTQTQLFQTFIEERTMTSDSGKFEKGVNRESLRRTKKIRPRLKSSSFSTRQASSIPSVPSPLSSSATPKTSLDSGSEDPSSPVSLTNFPNFSRSSTFTTTYRLNDPPVLGGAFSSSSFAAATTSTTPSSSQAISVPSSKKTQPLHVWSKGEVSRQGITSTASATIGLSPPSPPSLHRAFQPPPPTPQLQPQPQIQAKPPPQPQPLQQRRSSFHASVRKAFRLSPKRETTSEMGALLTILLSQEPKQNEGTGNETISKPGAYSSTVMNIFEPNTWKIKNRPLCADGSSCREDNPYHWIEYRHTPVEEEDDHLSEQHALEDAPPRSEARTDNYLQILEYLSRQHLKNGET
ncbi:Suppression of tumorigenicity 5 [Balamuthia mandrillaris]